jgi:hypothetical protein
MSPEAFLRRIGTLLFRRHGDVKSYERDVEAAGTVLGRTDIGIRTVPTEKVVGSVGRSHNLRSDFFYKSGAITKRFERVGQAMREGKILPPLEVIKVKRKTIEATRKPPTTEYYVVDGHHRVAMAKKLGQVGLDAHVVEVSITPTTPPDVDSIQTREAGTDTA